MRMLKSFSITVLALLFVALAVAVGNAGTRSRDNLRNYQNNIEILSDKSNNLDQLIGQLQGASVVTTSAAAPGGAILSTAITSGDAILFVVVKTSANLTAATTVHGVTDDRILFTSKVPGAAGNLINIAFTNQSASSTVNPKSLSVNTTGYWIEVKLATAAGSTVVSSAAAVVEAIRAHARANALLHAFAVGSGTGTVLAQSQFALNGGRGSAQAQFGVTNRDSTYLSNSTNYQVDVGTSMPVATGDSLDIYYNDDELR